MRVIRVFLSFLIVMMFIENASALGISDVVFKEAFPGKTYESNTTLWNSQNDFDNRFTIEISDNLKDWIKVAPEEFDLSIGESKQINITLNVPKNAVPKEIKGKIIAIGKNYAPAGNNDGSNGSKLSYTVATKGNIIISVVNPGAIAEVEIVDIDLPEKVPAKDIVKLNVATKNTGNVPTSANFEIIIKQGHMMYIYRRKQ